MAITVTSLTVLGTACPWKFGGSVNTGPTSTLATYNSGYNDGSNADGGTGSQNSAYRYGQQHVSPAGETAPTTMAVTPGQIILLEYLSGTVATQGGGAGNSPPTGSATTSLTPLPGGATDSSGYAMPTNVIRGKNATNVNGTCNTAGTAVTLTAGTVSPILNGKTVWINNAAFTVSVVTSPTTLTLTATAGTQTAVSFFYYGATTSIGGLVGAFTDGSGIITGVDGTFDWAGWGGTSSANSFILLTVPVGAAFLSLGINDSILRDNTGSFSLTAFQIDSEGWAGDQAPFFHFPFSGSGADSGYGPDHNTILAAIQHLGSYKLAQVVGIGDAMRVGFTGQLFPHGAQNSGGTPPGVGQNFPY